VIPIQDTIWRIEWDLYLMKGNQSYHFEISSETRFMKLKYILKKLIHDKGITVAHLSKATGIAGQTIHNWMLGAEPRSLTQVKKIADYFNVSLDYLCFGINSIHFQNNGFEKYVNEINAGSYEVILRKINTELKR